MPSERRAARALERQLAYQIAKSEALRADAPRIVAWCERRTAHLRARLSRLRPIDASTRVLEVGSGAHGHIFFLGPCDAIGVDPLAEEYRALFPWQAGCRTVAAYGESLPFEASSFDVLISDNVVDHAAAPDRIMSEIVRVLRPGGILYFTVNVHHRFWDLASRIHGALGALGVRVEVAPFADHTVHLTVEQARALVVRPELSIVEERVDLAIASEGALRPRHAGDLVKRAFFKNALFEAVARRC